MLSLSDQLAPTVPSFFISISFTPLSSHDHMIKATVNLWIYESNFKLVQNIFRLSLMSDFLSLNAAAQRYHKHLYLCTTTPFPGLLRRISQLALVYVQFVFYTSRRKYVEVYWPRLLRSYVLVSNLWLNSLTVLQSQLDIHYIYRKTLHWDLLSKETIVKTFFSKHRLIVNLSVNFSWLL